MTLFLQKSLWVATFILSLKTGLILGTSWLSLMYIIFIASLFGGGIVLLTQVFGNHQLVLAYFLDKYTFAGALLAGILLIYLGLQGTDVPNTCRAKKTKLAYFFAFLPCPACMAALAFTVLAMAPAVGVSAVVLGKRVAILFAILVIITALVARKLTNLTTYRHLTVFNQLLFFSGLITLVFAITIPNIVWAMAMAMNPIKIPSPKLLLTSIAIFGGFTLVGYLHFQISKKN